MQLDYAYGQNARYTAARNEMVDRQISSRGIHNELLLKAMKRVPRHLFVPEEYRSEAYGDFPLPIGYDQTISQPYIVAFMTDAVRPDKTKKVLEIGTGSGYQAAILAELSDSVFTVEIIPQLAYESEERLKDLGYSNIKVRSGDGYEGWTLHSPFDCIVVTAAATEVPQPLIDQLADNGRLVIPVGGPYESQDLVLIVKKHGKTERKNLLPVRFVPFRRR